MSLQKVLLSPLAYRLWKPKHWRLVVRDALNKKHQTARSHQDHLQAAIGWLCRAQDVRDGALDAGGVSAGWSFQDGWLPSYPETTGYIIETFLAASKLLGRPDLETRALRMLDWELSLQQSDGAFPGHFGEPGSHPVVFNQGQIMHGMIAGFIHFKRNDCLEAAVKGGHWLMRHQEPDGSWRKFEHLGVPHTYNTRGTWALLAAGMLSNEQELVRAAVRHLEWALCQQAETGWFQNNAFTPDRYPFTHTIAYAIRGFLESGVLLGEERYLNAAQIAASKVAQAQRSDGWLSGELDTNWNSRASYACLTGIAQMALNWLRLSQEGRDPRLEE
ncbi:MAG: prenyltransferase/squalene oxidase repeat-containing protein, partial [Burkholderiales bacterium]